MVSLFRMLAYAIAVVAIISVVYFIMLPLLFPQPDNVAVVERNLKAAETGLGMSFSAETFVQQGEGLKGSTFDSRNRNINFKCNSAELCCPRGEECPLPIEWDSKALKFKESRQLLMTARCRLEQGLYACDVFAGEYPAQVEIDSVNAPEEIDLGSEQLAFEVTFSNTGNQETQQAEAGVEIYQRYQEEGRWTERLLEKYSKTESFGLLRPGQARTEKIYVALKENGSFRAEIKVSGLEAGYEEKSVQFTAVGGSNTCSASYCEKPAFSEGKCTARCHCESCMHGSECLEKLAEAGNDFLGLPESTSIENAETSVLGSNIVDVTLEAASCRSDLKIAEPKAVTNQVSFKVENVSGNPVQSPFEVVAYTGYGTTSQKKVGSATVLAEEINSGYFVEKSIVIYLSEGEHSLELVANEARTEKEEDYGNNNASIAVDIPGTAEMASYEFENPDMSGGSCCGKEFYVVRNLFSEEEDAITLIEAISGGKVRADFAGEGFNMNARVQNLTEDRLKIRVSLGQVFVDKQRINQNLGKNVSDKVIELPTCAVWVGELSNSCLNLERPIPKFESYDVGEVVKDSDVLLALESGSQGKVWEAVENASMAPKDFGSEGSIRVPLPTDFSIELSISQGKCKEAGLI